MEDNPNKEAKEEYKFKQKKNANRLLNILLAIIVIITVFSGSIIYYSLYKYSKSDNYIEDNSPNKSEASTVADIISGAIDDSEKNELNDETQNNSSENATVSTETADSRKVLNEAIIVLYKGLVLDSKDMNVVELKYIDNSSTLKDDYVITYYNYENYEFKNSSLGTLSSQVLDGLVKINNVGKVAISEKYEAIPREIQVINSIPAVVLDNNSSFNNYDTKKTIITDLDGNDTNEYIIILANKSTGESKVVLAESTGFIKDTIAQMNKSGWDSVSTDGYYLSYNNVEVLDIDNDGIMEILFEIPTTDAIPSQISLLKYKNGDLSGKTQIVCSLVK
jgi:hypothetical protein